MSVIDKHMYEKLKNWCDGERPKNQFMMYVNSSDRALTDATIKKLMYEIEEEDIDGEEYVSFYSAKNFYHNMRKYYSHVSELYMKKPSENDPIEDIIESMPPTGGWITLIIEDVETLSGDEEKMEEMFNSLFSFACKCSKVILIGNGDYTEAFSGCEYALQKMAERIAAKPEDNVLMIGCYDQEENPAAESVVYDTEEDRRDELYYYWDSVYDRLEKGYFDYSNFKVLFKETLEYLIPRVTKEQVYRKDLELIEKIGAMRSVKDGIADGCQPWEFDAAKQFASGLHIAIVNKYDLNDDFNNNNDFSSGGISLFVVIEERNEDHGALHFGGHFCPTIPVRVDTVYQKIDSLAEIIRNVTYEGRREKTMQMLRNIGEDFASGMSAEQAEKLDDDLNSLMSGIKEFAEKTVNKEPGRKVRRFKGSRSETDDLFAPKEGEKSKLKILEKKYDISADKIKGHEKLDPEQLKEIGDCKLIRYITLLDETGYTVNADGNAEMTKASQKEYDDFVLKIRRELMRDGIRIIDEGYGSDENELEWHITFTGVAKEAENGCVSVFEIETCVRTNDVEDQ